jgi:large subunit ribosomal protein L7/L12
MADLAKLVEELGKLTVLEAAELVKMLEEKWGVSAAAPVAIKVIRQLTALGLVEAKTMAETAGAKVLAAVSKEAANDAKAKLEAAGAVVVVA